MDILDGYLIDLLNYSRNDKDSRHVFSTLSNIYDGAFFENSLQFKPKSSIIDILQNPKYVLADVPSWHFPAQS